MSSFNKLHLIRQVDLFTLKLFLSAVEERQIGRAAARENIAASAATKRIQDLEDIVGLKLLDRSPKGVVPSPAGEVLARHFRMILENLDDMRGELTAFTEGVRGLLPIASTGAIIIQFLARELADYSREFPLVDVTLQEDTNPNVVRAVLTGNADVAVFIASPDLDLDALDTAEYRTDRMVAVVPRGHPLTERPSVTFEDLLRQNFIGIAPGTSLMATLQNAAKSIGRELKPKYSVNRVEVANSLVQAGLGVTIQPECMLSLEHYDRVSAVALDEPWAVRSLRVGTLRGRAPGAAARAFINQLLDRPRSQSSAAPRAEGALAGGARTASSARKSAPARVVPPPKPAEAS